MKRLALLGAVILITACQDTPTAPAARTEPEIRNSVGSTIVVVTNLADAGVGSLRWALAVAPPGAVVRFKAGLVGTIELASGQLVIDKAVTVRGPGAERMRITQANDPADGRLLWVSPTGDASIEGLTFAGGRVLSFVAGRDNGGAIYNEGSLVLQSCLVRDSYAFLAGAGVFNAGKLEVRQSRITANVADKSGGGGIANTGVLIINRSTIDANVSRDGGEGAGVLSRSGYLTITNSTIAGNRNLRGYGGGVSVEFGQAILTNTTISGNFATFGGGIHNTAELTSYSGTVALNRAERDRSHGIMNAGKLELFNTIVALNRGPDATFRRGDISSSGTVKTAASLLGTPIRALQVGVVDAPIVPLTTDVGGNLIGVSDGAVALGPLAENGGPTLTHALMPGSVARDAGRLKHSRGAYDQRGNPFARVVDGNPDMGAVETFGTPLGSMAFRVTSIPLGVAEDKAGACKAEFGDAFRIADWNDVTAAMSRGALAVDIVPSDIGHTWGTRDGAAFWDGTRHYIVSSAIHPGYLAHAENAAAGGTMWLGSWFESYHVLCFPG